MTGVSKMECKRRVGMSHAGTSKKDVKKMKENFNTSKLIPVLNR